VISHVTVTADRNNRDLTPFARKTRNRIAVAIIGAVALLVGALAIHEAFQPASPRSEIGRYLKANGLDDSVEVERCTRAPNPEPSSVPDWYFNCAMIVRSTVSLRPGERLDVPPTQVVNG